MILASADAMERLTSLTNLRHLPSHAKVRSTTQRRGRTVQMTESIEFIEEIKRKREFLYAFLS